MSPDGTFVVSGGDDATVRIWDVEPPGERHRLEGHTGAVWGCAVSPDARVVVSVSWDETLRVWDARSGRELMRLDMQVGLHGAAFHPARSMAAVGDLTGSLHLIELVGLEHGPIVVTARATDGATTIRCPRCAHEHAVGDDALGGMLPCPSCRTALRLTPVPVRRRARPTSGDEARRRRVAQLLGEPVSRERQLMHSTKTCAGCGNEVELLRYACARCGSPQASPPTFEAFEFMQMRQQRASHHVDRGSLLFQQGRLDEAEEEFHRAIEANPWNATAHANVGVVLLRRNRVEEALGWFEKALDLDPQVAGVREMVDRNRAELARSEGGHRAVETDTERSVAEETAAAQAAMQAHDWDRAVHHYDTAIRGAERHGEAAAPAPLWLLYGERATAHAHGGDRRAALADYDEALERNPGEWHYLDARARVHHVMGRHDLAVEGYTRVLSILPGSGDRTAGVLMYRADAYRELGDPDAALADLRSAERLAGDEALLDTIRQMIEQVLADGGR